MKKVYGIKITKANNFLYSIPQNAPESSACPVRLP